MPRDPRRWLVSLCSLLLLASIARAGATFRVTDEVLTKHFVGFGVNVSPWVYCAPNWPAEVNDTNVADFERKVIDLAPQHVRIFIKPEWWDTEKERYRGQSVERLCRLMLRAGATVNLTLWGGVKDKPEEMGRRTADAIAHLIRDEKLTCIRYATLQNEPNGFDMDKGRYVTLYRTFDAELRRQHVRDRLQIIGGDLLYNHQDEWFARLATDLPDLLDGYSVHIYSDYWDPAHMQKRLTEIPPIVASLPPAGQKPLYLMEFGVRGHRKTRKEEPGTYEDGTPLYDQPLTANILAYHVIEALNLGYIATAQWDLADAMYDRSVMYYGVIGEAKNGFPLKPAYHVLNLFTHAAGPEWRTLKVTGGDPNYQVAAAMRSGKHWTIFAANRTTKSDTTIVEGLPPNRWFHLRLWTADHSPATEVGQVKSDRHGTLEIALPPLGVAALTTK